MTFSEAYEEWHPEKLRVVKMTTMAAYDLAYRTHLRPAFGSADVDCIRRRLTARCPWLHGQTSPSRPQTAAPPTRRSYTCGKRQARKERKTEIAETFRQLRHG